MPNNQHPGYPFNVTCDTLAHFKFMVGHAIAFHEVWERQTPGIIIHKGCEKVTIVFLPRTSDTPPDRDHGGARLHVEYEEPEELEALQRDAATNQAQAEKVVPADVRGSEFGCRNCLFSGCECQGGIRYVPARSYDGKHPSCSGYAYYD
jgi:hypothetical protein